MPPRPRAEAEGHEERPQRAGTGDEEPQRGREGVAQQREGRREEHRQRLPRRAADRVEIEVHDLASPDDPGPRVVGRRGRLEQAQRGDREARDHGPPDPRSRNDGDQHAWSWIAQHRRAAYGAARPSYSLGPGDGSPRAHHSRSAGGDRRPVDPRPQGPRPVPDRARPRRPGRRVRARRGRDHAGSGPRPADLPAAAPVRRRLLLQPARAQGQRAVRSAGSPSASSSSPPERSR